MSKLYTCSQAKITADNGETMKADIMETGEVFTSQLFELRESSRRQYWRLHTEIAKHGFNYPQEQTSAVAKLGQLAIALEAIEKAYSAANTVRCFT